jgi:hypothetical protein
MATFDVDSLLEMVDDGELDAISQLVAEKGEAVILGKDEWGLTALHVASATGNEVRATCVCGDRCSTQGVRVLYLPTLASLLVERKSVVAVWVEAYARKDIGCRGQKAPCWRG